MAQRERPAFPSWVVAQHYGVDRYQCSARRVCAGEASSLRSLPRTLLLVPLHFGLLLDVVLLLALGFVLLAAFVAHVEVLLAAIMTHGGDRARAQPPTLLSAQSSMSPAVYASNASSPRARYSCSLSWRVGPRSLVVQVETLDDATYVVDAANPAHPLLGRT